MPTFCLDTSAWLEYLNAGPYGPTIKRLLEGTHRVLTPAVVAAEVVEAARHRKNNTQQFIEFIVARTEFAAPDPEIARLAGKMNAERTAPDSPWSMLESLVLATARHHGARLVTRDPLYEDEPDVEFLAPVKGAVALGASAARTKDLGEP